MKFLIFIFLIPSFSLVIDPGHGGEDCGICFSNFSEKEITLKLAEGLRDQLSGEFDIYFTRGGDYSVPQDERVGYANRRGDLFISFHINRSFSQSLSGTIIYIPSISPQNCNDVPLILWEMANACVIEETEKLALSVKNEMDGFRDVRLVRISSFVLMGLKIPGILIEVGFYEEKDLLLSEIWRMDFLKRVGYGIKKYRDERKK